MSDSFVVYEQRRGQNGDKLPYLGTFPTKTLAEQFIKARIVFYKERRKYIIRERGPAYIWEYTPEDFDES